eukprot:Rmarinus@m.13433
MKLLLYIFVLLLSWVSCYSTADDSYTVGFVGPFFLDWRTNPADDIGFGFQLAIDEVNSSPSILPGVKLNVLYNSSGMGEQGSFFSAEWLIDQGVVALIGEFDSVHTRMVAYAGEWFQVPLVSPAATSDFFTMQEYFSYTTRTMLSDEQQAWALAGLLRAYGFSEIAMVYAADPYATLLASTFQLAAIRSNITILVSEGLELEFYTDLTPQFQRVKDTGASVVVSIMLVSSMQEVIGYAKSVGLCASHHTWVGVDGWMTESLFVHDDAQVVMDVEECLQGAIGTAAYVATGSAEYIYANTTWATSPPSTLFPDVDTTAGMTRLGAYAYDTALAVAYAIEAVVDAGGSPSDGDAMQSAIRGVHFNGTTGSVSYDEVGSRQGKFNVCNVWNHEIRLTGSAYVDENGVFHQIVDSPVFWKNGNSTPPDPAPTHDPHKCANGQHTCDDDEPPPPDVVNFAMFFSLFNNIDPSVHVLEDDLQAYEAFLMALRQVNNKTDGILDHVLPYTQLEAIAVEAGTDTARSRERVRELLNLGLPLAAVTGLSFSSVSLEVYDLFVNERLSQISYAATVSDLSSSSEYSYFYRTIPADTLLIEAMVTTLSNKDAHNWRRVALMYEASEAEDPYIPTLYSTFKEFAADAGMLVGGYPATLHNCTDTLRHIANDGFHIIGLFFWSLNEALACADEAGMYGSGFTYFSVALGDMENYQSALGMVTVSAETSSEMMENFRTQYSGEYVDDCRGYLGTDCATCRNTTDSFGRTLFRFDHDDDSVTPEYCVGSARKDTIFNYTPYAYDSAVALALAVDGVLSQSSTISSILVKEQLGFVSFEGVTGFVSFTEEGDRAEGVMAIWSVHEGGVLMQVGTYNSSRGLQMSCDFSDPTCVQYSTDDGMRPEDGCDRQHSLDMATVVCVPCPPNTFAEEPYQEVCYDCESCGSGSGVTAWQAALAIMQIGIVLAIGKAVAMRLQSRDDQVWWLLIRESVTAVMLVTFEIADITTDVLTYVVVLTNDDYQAYRTWYSACMTVGVTTSCHALYYGCVNIKAILRRNRRGARRSIRRSMADLMQLHGEALVYALVTYESLRRRWRMSVAGLLTVFMEDIPMTTLNFLIMINSQRTVETTVFVSSLFNVITMGYKLANFEKLVVLLHTLTCIPQLHRRKTPVMLTRLQEGTSKDDGRFDPGRLEAPLPTTRIVNVKSSLPTNLSSTASAPLPKVHGMLRTASEGPEAGIDVANATKAGGGHWRPISVPRSFSTHNQPDFLPSPKLGCGTLPPLLEETHLQSTSGAAQSVFPPRKQKRPSQTLGQWATSKIIGSKHVAPQIPTPSQSHTITLFPQDPGQSSSPPPSRPPSLKSPVGLRGKSVARSKRPSSPRLKGLSESLIPDRTERSDSAGQE